MSSTVTDVTLENNLSRVVTAVSHALTSSTSRALTVSFEHHFLTCSVKASSFVFLR